MPACETCPHLNPKKRWIDNGVDPAWYFQNCKLNPGMSISQTALEEPGYVPTQTCPLLNRKEVNDVRR